MSSALTIGEIAAVVGIAGGVNSLTGGGVTNALGMGPKSASGGSVQQAADPFAPYRGDMAKQYSDAMKPGAQTDITQMPGYSQFQSGVMDPALEASKRSGAASGMMQSGNEKLALQKTAQQGYYGFMTDYMNRLAQGSGATQNPATAAGMGNNQNNQNLSNSMAGLGAISQGLAGLYGGSQSYTGGGNSYGAVSNGWVQDASTMMPSLDAGNIDPSLGWSI
jgi:hypothetical protein